ncbi:MAG: transglutaminase domain-containing protein [Clostridiales bacterium]|nr:transglutaminase domain-containing protein [Clostridiales bacterium]
MKKSFFSVPRTLPLHALTTFLIGVGCVWPLSLSLGLTAPLSLCLTACGAVTLLFALLDCMPHLRALAYPLLLLAIGGSVLSLRGQFSAVGAALTLMVHGQPLALAAYSQALSLLLSLVFTGIGASLSRSEQAFFPLALLEIALLFIVSFLGAQIGAASLLPLILALLLSGRAPGVRARRIVPLCAAILAATALLMPLSAQVSPELNQLAQRVRRMLDDYLFFTDARTTFSLSATGYQPLGVSQLGGPANPEDTPVMQVRTSGRTLLRGTIKNEYDGHAWADSTSGRRYLYVNPRFYALRRDLFDQKRPSDAIRAQLPAGETITVLMRADAASTLYLTQRFSALSGHEIVPYFSPASEVFGTRSLAFGDSYTFTGLRLSGDTPGIREAVLAAAHHSDAYADTVRADYLALPDGVETGVYALAGQITQDAQTDFDRAAALCAYLRSAYPYTLAQNVPPAGRDFVSWFLLDERQGYCTSFATAMAVMARMVGLPARYIEGYAAVPDSDSVARVTQQQAHAWVEIYFAGFGWLPFDPTPGANDAGGTLPSDNPEGDSPTPSPSPTATPTPSPSPAPDASPSPTPSPSPEPDSTPTPEPDAPSDTPSPTPPPSDDEPPRDPPHRLWPPLLLLLLALLAALRLYLCAPAQVARRQKNANDALLVWYRAAEDSLLCMGIAPLPGEAPASFLWRAQGELHDAVKLTGLGKALCVAQYSGRTLKRTQPERAQKVYAALFAQMTLRQKLRLFARRFIRGIRL